jgi:hypothetical protein
LFSDLLKEGDKGLHVIYRHGNPIVARGWDSVTEESFDFLDYWKDTQSLEKEENNDVRKT